MSYKYDARRETQQHEYNPRHFSKDDSLSQKSTFTAIWQVWKKLRRLHCEYSNLGRSSQKIGF